MSSNKITHETRIRMLSELPAEVVRKTRELELAFAERRVRKLKEALANDQSDIDVAFEADGLSWTEQASRLNKGWEPGGIEP